MDRAEEETVSRFDELNTLVEQDFFRVYEIEKAIGCGRYDRTERVGRARTLRCRYCFRMPPRATFKKQAHLFPRFLGNRYVLSGQECDDCNERFGHYEDSLANYLAAYRPFGFAPKEAGEVKYKFEGGLGSFLEIVQDQPHHVTITTCEDDPSFCEFDESTGRFTIRAVRKPYVPLHVLKSLIKMGYGLLDEQRLPHFTGTRKILTSDEYDDRLSNSPYCNVLVSHLYGPPVFTEPVGFLAHKKPAYRKKRFPNTVFILGTMNHLFQVFLPYDRADGFLYGGRAAFLRFPALLPLSASYDDFDYAYDHFLLNSTDRVFGEEHVMHFITQEALRAAKGKVSNA